MAYNKEETQTQISKWNLEDIQGLHLTLGNRNHESPRKSHAALDHRKCIMPGRAEQSPRERWAQQLSTGSKGFDSSLGKVRGSLDRSSTKHKLF